MKRKVKRPFDNEQFRKGYVAGMFAAEKELNTELLHFAEKAHKIMSEGTFPDYGIKINFKDSHNTIATNLDMITEEKAKKYDEALEWIRKVYSTLTGANKEDTEYYFPELKESEDERIRKAILSALRGGIDTEKYLEKHGTNYGEVETWLEKQKEQKPAEWSEEDEKMRKTIIQVLKSYIFESNPSLCGSFPTYYLEKSFRAAKDWLESLPGRFNLQQQPKQEQKEPSDKGEISDGYHTFNELYYYRLLYNAAFFNLLPKEWVHKSKRHHDGEECFGGGWFIVTANLPTGQISNHYEIKDWDLFHIPEKETADEWDGHTPQQAAERLHKFLLEMPEQMPTEYLPKEKVYDIMSKLTDLSYSNLVLINSEEYKKIDEITSDVRDLLNYPIEQKPVEWSEEDEHRCKDAIYFLETAKKHYADTSEIELTIEWLKFLRPQPKKELSIEKAIKWLDDTFYFLDNSSGRGRDCEITTHDFDSLEEMYDSFRKAVIVDSEPHWKPKDEQMIALKCAIEDIAKFSKRGGRQVEFENEPYYMALHSLYEQLKKLM